MKNILKKLPLFLLVCFGVNAQNLEKADKNYNNLAYVDAINTYESVAKKGYKSVDLFQKLGNSYYFNAKLKEANKWYAALFDMNQEVEPEYFYRYSQTLKATENYEKADQYLEKFYELAENDKRATLYKNQKDYKSIIAKNSGRYEVKTTNINSAFSDYGAAMYGTQLIFSSSRENASLAKVNTKWTSNEFLNLYTVKRAEDGILSNPEKFSNSVNSKFHEDTPVFTKDMKTVYFTRNNYTNGKVGKNQEEKVLLKLYRASLVNGKWIDIIEVPFNSNNYSVAHPALSPDEKTLYFASNMPGTKGQSDLFKVEITGDNTYSTPVNLTGSLNTEGRETFPHITQDNELYFASDGQLGLGGLDIFVTKLDKEGNPGDIINVGAPINGPMDDFAFLIDLPSSSGYFSSNRDGGIGLDDIFYFKQIKTIELGCNQELVGVITNSETGEVLSNTKVTLFDENFKELQVTQSDAKGNYSFPVQCNEKYYVRNEKEEFETKEAPIKISNISGKTELSLATAKKIIPIKVGTDLAKLLNIAMLYFDTNKSLIRKDAALELEKVLEVMKKYPTMAIDIRSHTDCRATAVYNKNLSDRRAKSTMAWLVSQGIESTRLNAKGYGESNLINKCADGVFCSEEEHQVNRRSEFIVVRI